MKKKIDKYTNYGSYILMKRAAHEVDKTRLVNAVDKLTEKYKNPYIRFMWVSNVDTAMCVMYSDLKKNEKLTKLVPFDEAEKVIMNN